MQRSARYVTTLTTLATLALAGSLASACGSSTGTDVDAPDNRLLATVNLTPTLTQSVAISPASPVSGTNITVRSVLVNSANTAVQLESRICGLDYAGSLTITHPPEVLKCAGYSRTETIAPGDSVVALDYMRVTSEAGTYSLRVKQAVQPTAWAEVQVQVRAR